MIQIRDILNFLATVAPPTFQESYDNSGLITGNRELECTGILVTLDATEEVVREAIRVNCNLIVAHHPILFSAIKRITGDHYVERALILAIKHDIAIYAIHTNLDNVAGGVNSKMAALLGLKETRPLEPIHGQLKKLVTYVPQSHVDQVRNALFSAGAGHIGQYDECSFNVEGVGTFKGGENTQPFVGQQGVRHFEPETRVEMIFPIWLETQLLQALRAAHPYEEVAYDIYKLENEYPGAGGGLIGEWPAERKEIEFLDQLKSVFRLSVIRHTPLLGQKIKKMALCGGAGSFLIPKAIREGATAFITGDIKYHEFFEADGKILLVDIGHFESEQFTIDLLIEILQGKFLNFAVLKSGVKTNPINYYF